jgi:hypothetical protein
MNLETLVRELQSLLATEGGDIEVQFYDDAFGPQVVEDIKVRRTERGESWAVILR